jgi:BioD-like phosphotransacetylase family protein
MIIDGAILTAVTIIDFPLSPFILYFHTKYRSLSVRIRTGLLPEIFARAGILKFNELHVIFNEIFKYCEPKHIANLTLNYELSINLNIKLILLE